MMGRRQFLAGMVATTICGVSTARTDSLLRISHSGRRAMIIPGNDLCAPFYVPLAEQLAARGMQVTLVTLPGYDGTPGLDPVSIPAVLDWLRPLVRTEVGAEGVLIGHSLGGLLAALLAADPEVDMGSLALLEPALVPSRWIAKLMARRYGKHTVESDRTTINPKGAWYRRIHDPETFPSAAMAIAVRCRNNSDPAIARTFIQGFEEIYPLPLDRIDVPTLLLRGASSGWVMARGQRMVQRRISGARSVVIPGAAHFLANENDAAIADAIAAFAAS